MQFALHFQFKTMPTRKSETLNVRLDGSMKQALKELAEAENRSISNLIEHLIATQCKKLGIEVKKPTPKKPAN